MRLTTLAIAILALPALSQAQSTVTLTSSVTSGNESITTVLTWETSPPIAEPTPCTASSPHPDWNGPKPSSGMQTITISQSGTLPLTLTCNFPGDSIVTFSWVNPTANTDGSPYNNPDIVRIKYTFNPLITADPRSADTGEVHVDVPQNPNPRTTHTVTGIAQAGTLRALGFARNMNGVWSEPSNSATKAFTGSFPVTQSVSITVNPKPSPLTGLTSN